MIEQKDKTIAALREEVAAAVKHGEELKQIYLELVKANDDVKTNLNTKSNEVLLIRSMPYALACTCTCKNATWFTSCREKVIILMSGPSKIV